MLNLKNFPFYFQSTIIWGKCNKNTNATYLSNLSDISFRNPPTVFTWSKLIMLINVNNKLIYKRRNIMLFSDVNYCQLRFLLNLISEETRLNRNKRRRDLIYLCIFLFSGFHSGEMPIFIAEISFNICFLFYLFIF